MPGTSKVQNDCKPCKRKQTTAEPKKQISLLSGILLALLPKCPFCFMAFSSTIMLCGEAGNVTAQHTFTSSTTITVTIFFCLLTLISVIFNYRDNRTKYAIGLVLLGSAFIALSVLAKGGLPLYYSGVGLIFTGVWLNASLLYFVKKIRGYFNKKGSSQLLKHS